ncbi:MAG: FAD-binding protein [Myxococcaceae bacterium]|nr:FAD-binding protein [Myxococcaceae bacterium]MBH2006702.1 FAD-binding protein [Myxococcaceae bacterium]
MLLQTDVLVIGSGVAGAMALRKAQDRGLRTMGLTRGLGASAYSSGKVDAFAISDEVQQAFLSLTQELRYLPSTLAVREDGHLVSAMLVQASHFVDFDRVRPDSLVGVMDFSGMPSFHAAPVCRMLESHGFRAVPIRAAVSPQSGCWKSFREFARAFEDPDFVDECLDKMVGALNLLPKKPAHVFVPAIFGSRDSPLVFLRSIQMRTDIPCSELLGASFSIPGVRLSQILERGFERAKVARFELKDGKIERVRLSDGRVVEPKALILATGRYLSGGFEDQEAIFELPIVGDSFERQGLRVNERQQPLDRFGRLFATNLFAAGSSIGGYDPKVDGGMARAMASGYRAGELC